MVVGAAAYVASIRGNHNALPYSDKEKAFIISLLTNFKLVKTPQTLSLNAEVASWNKSPWNVSCILPSLMFEDNVGEDGLSSQSSYTININDSTEPFIRNAILWFVE
jgi:hypothetical protein